MANFSLPDWYLPPADPPPPPRPAEFDIANAAREQQLNDQYLAGRREILNTGDGAYFRTQGEAAIHAGPPPSRRAIAGVKELSKNFDRW